MRRAMIWIPTHIHKKGREYRIIGYAKHSETEEALVVYEDRSGLVWARPEKMFFDGRFEKIEYPEILEIREVDDDGTLCELMGFYCKGHIDKSLFGDLCNRYSGASDYHDDRWVSAVAAQHGYWRIVPVFGCKGVSRFEPAAGPGRGAFAVTFCESLVNVRRKKFREIERWSDSAARSASFAAISWAYHWLTERFPEIGEKMLKAWREDGDKKK